MNLSNKNPKKFNPPKYGEFIQFGGTNYQIGEVINNGFFGIVHECVDEWGNELVAKVILPKKRSYKSVRDTWLKELSNLSKLRHPNITYVHAAFEYQDTFYLFLERCEFSLNIIIQMKGLVPDLWIPYLARDILNGLHFIHQNNVVHKDLHAGNILISGISDLMTPNTSEVYRFKIADLGIANLETKISPEHTLLANWMHPPEFIDRKFGDLGKQIDIYHFGLILLYLEYGKILKFTEDEIINGAPRRLAESLKAKFSGPIARALRRHTEQ
ncbi:protein kinase family protein [Leptospira santarosai]|uniref:protein kinase family protein n=1 Tax=Leptospira santarosai TaxID=28183 RepID=UPI0024AF612A|nr:protein kinase family protein [Leptospira santarosai]MDI7208593.1 protein kinase family protein [Leptospira santarosai]